MIHKIETSSLLTKEYQKLKAALEYIEDPTYSRSISSHVCLTCSRFDYSKKTSDDSNLYCMSHQKLICHGQHLTHSCELYQIKKV